MIKFFLKPVSILCILFSLAGCSPGSDYSNVIIESISTSLSSKEPVNSEIQLSPRLTIPVVFDVTSKGNGTLNINGLVLRVFDLHDDGSVFKDDYLQLNTKDLNGDGIAELIFTGTLKLTGENKADPVTFEPVKAVYTLDCKSGLFKTFESQPNSFIEISNHQKQAISCK